MSDINREKSQEQNLSTRSHTYLSDNVKIEIIHAVRDILLKLIEK